MAEALDENTRERLLRPQRLVLFPRPRQLAETISLKAQQALATLEWLGRSVGSAPASRPAPWVERVLRREVARVRSREEQWVARAVWPAQAEEFPPVLSWSEARAALVEGSTLLRELLSLGREGK